MIQNQKRTTASSKREPLKSDTHNSDEWLGRLANLNTARTEARGIAPHKPLMLLTVIDLIESGDIPDGWVKYDVRLVSRFRDYWELVRERQRNQPEIPMPFHAVCGARDRFTDSSPRGQSLAAFDAKPLYFHDHARLRPVEEDR